MATEDEEQATQEVADYLRRQEWDVPDAHKIDDVANERVRQLWWIQRAEDVLDAVAEAGAKLYGGDLSLDDDEVAILKARIDAALFEATEIRNPELVSERVLDAVKGFINGQVV